jgi:hypothetical protein
MSESVNNNNNIITSNMTSIFFQQENRGKRWSQEEDNYLLQQVQFLSHLEIGKFLKRSENAVISRLKKLAFHMIQNGEDDEVVKNNLKLTTQDMDQINNEFFIYPRKVPPPSSSSSSSTYQSKFIVPIKKPVKKGYFIPPQTPELQLLYEIRNMLRKILYKDCDYKSPRKSVNISSLNNTGNENTNRYYDLNLEELEKKSEEFARMSDK